MKNNNHFHIFKENLIEHLSLFNELEYLEDNVNSVIDLCLDSIRNGGKIMFCGNGGSAADSQHLAAEFTGRFIKDREPIAAISLTTDTSALTCISNDYSYDQVFSRQVQAIGNKNDCLIGISTSGNSKNILKAFKIANEKGIATVGLLGKNGGEIVKHCKISIVVPSYTTARIQEAHILIGHSICGAVEKGLNLV